MWLLIEVNKQEDIGKDESRRILIDEGCMDIFEDGCGMIIECGGVDVHPNTPDSATPSHAVNDGEGDQVTIDSEEVQESSV